MDGLWNFTRSVKERTERDKFEFLAAEQSKKAAYVAQPLIGNSSDEDLYVTETRQELIKQLIKTTDSIFSFQGTVE